MPFDPSKPAANSPLSSEEIRNQLNGLKAELEDSFTNQLNGLAGNKANEVSDIEPLSLTISDPPTQGQVQEIHDKLNALIESLKN